MLYNPFVRQLLLASALALGCADPSPPPAVRDATLDDVTDAGDDAVDAPFDATLDAPRDAVRDAPRDAAAEAGADVAAPEDVVIDPGTCGPLTRECLCDCGGGGPCQNACIARSDDCSFCIFEAATRCCPDEWRVLDDCITRSMCADDPCIAARCGADQRRLETCFAAAQAGDESCRREMRTCLGSDYPMIRCLQAQ